MEGSRPVFIPSGRNSDAQTKVMLLSLIRVKDKGRRRTSERRLKEMMT